MIKVRDNPVKFEQIQRTHIFAANTVLYTRTEWEGNAPIEIPKEEQHFLQKIGPNKAMTLDKSTIVYFNPNDLVLRCDIQQKNVQVKQAS